jgi:hypothetical protein
MSDDYLNEANYGIIKGGKWSKCAIQFTRSFLSKTPHINLICEIKSSYQEPTDLPNLANQKSMNK